MFVVVGVDEVLERLRKRGAQLVIDVVQRTDAYPPCDVRGPEEILIRVAQELSSE